MNLAINVLLSAVWAVVTIFCIRSRKTVSFRWFLLALSFYLLMFGVGVYATYLEIIK